MQSWKSGENQKLDGRQYDYGARLYDPVIARWTKIDQKSELYYATSPYVYALDQPSNAIDKDGDLVIFVNGNHFGSGGSAKYWRWPITAYGGHIGGHMNHAYKSFFYFDSAVEDIFRDHNESFANTSLNVYKDGGLGGDFFGISLGVRVLEGYYEGQMDAATIVSHLARDINGNIIESIKIITHSMGAGYAKGYIEALIDYVKAHSELCQGLVINEYDIAAFQSGDQEAIIGTTTNQFANSGDDVNSSLLGSPNRREKGTASYKEYAGGSHSLSDFKWVLNLLLQVPQGKVHWDASKQQFVSGN